MLWKGVSRISLADAVLDQRCRPPWWHCSLKRGASRSSGLRVTIFSSAGRPPPLVRAEEVSAPLEGSIRTTRRALMRSEVEAHALLIQTSGEGQRGQGRPQTTSAASIDIRRSDVHAERNVQLPSTAALAGRRGPLDSLRETLLSKRAIGAVKRRDLRYLPVLIPLKLVMRAAESPVRPARRPRPPCFCRHSA